MTIQLHINGVIQESWYYEDIKYGYLEKTAFPPWIRALNLIAEIEKELGEVIKSYDYQFAVVYQSKLNYWSLKEVFAEHFNQET